MNQIKISLYEESIHYKKWFDNFDDAYRHEYSKWIANNCHSYGAIELWINFCKNVLPSSIRLVDWKYIVSLDSEIGTIEYDSEEELTAFILKWS